MLEWSHAGHTLGPSPGVRSRWRRGRDRYAVWLARMDDPRLRPRLRAAREALRPWIRPTRYQDLHLTVWVAGFPCEAPAMDDDVSEAVLAAQARRIAAAGPFEIEVLGLRSFASAAYLAVRDPSGALTRLREGLGLLHREQRFGPFAPHLTVGVYRARWPAGPIDVAMEPLQTLGPLRIRIDAIERVDLDARRAGAPLVASRTITLGEP